MEQGGQGLADEGKELMEQGGSSMQERQGLIEQGEKRTLSIYVFAYSFIKIMVVSLLSMETFVCLFSACMLMLILFEFSSYILN